MAEPHGHADSTEAMAFQLLLQKITGLERAMQGIPPLLAKIIAHLEAQQAKPEVPVASYAALYPEIAAPEPVAADEEAPPCHCPLPGRTHGRLWRWLHREA